MPIRSSKPFAALPPSLRHRLVRPRTGEGLCRAADILVWRLVGLFAVPLSGLVLQFVLEADDSFRRANVA
jgi:hypothetical protein